MSTRGPKMRTNSKFAKRKTRTGQVTVLIIGIAKTLRNNGSADKMISNCPCCEYCDHSIETYCWRLQCANEKCELLVNMLAEFGGFCCRHCQKHISTSKACGTTCVSIGPQCSYITSLLLFIFHMPGISVYILLYSTRCGWESLVGVSTRCPRCFTAQGAVGNP